MPTVRDLRCTLNTRAGAMIEYIPPPEDPTTPYLPDTPNTHNRYVNITGCENERLHIKLDGNEEFRWSEALCTKITADFYIDGILVGTRPYYENFQNGLPPSIVFGAVKKFEVELQGGDYRGVEKRAGLTFKEVEFAEKDDEIPLPGVTDPLGEISVKVYRYRGGYSVQRYQHEFQHRSLKYVTPAMASEKILTERDVKGRGIQYLIGTNQFQEALPRQKVSQDDNRGQLVTRTIDMEMVDPYHRPYVCFRFLYRTQAHLEGLGLITSTGKNSTQHRLPHRNLLVGGVKRKRESGSPSGFRTFKIERRDEPIKISDSDDDDDLVVLNGMPPEFKQRKIPSLFQLSSSEEKGKGKADPKKESLFLPFESRAPTSDPPTPQCAPIAREKDLGFRIIYKEDSDGTFIAIREPVKQTKRRIYVEDEAGDSKQVNFGADQKPISIEVKAKIQLPEAGPVSVIHRERVNFPTEDASSIPEPKLQTMVSQNQERDFIGFEEGDEDSILYY